MDQIQHRIPWEGKNKIYHILFWLIWFVFWILINYFASQGRTEWAKMIAFNLLYVSCHITASYLLINLIVPHFLWRRKIIGFILFFFLDGLVFASLIAGSFYIVYHSYPEALNYFFQWKNLVPATIGSTFSIMYGFMMVDSVSNWLRIERRNRLLAKEKTKAEMDFLKSQLDPHLLFNVINSIYFLIKKDADKACEALAKFSDMLRYQLYESNASFINLEEEIRYLKNFAEMEHIRKGEKLTILFRENIETSVSIAPLIMFPFVENALKYVPNDGKVDISINTTGGSFSLEVINTKLPIQLTKTGGIGLSNVRRRLDLIYPKSYNLTIENTEIEYKIYLNINTYAHQNINS